MSTAIVVHVRGESFTAERARLARVALSDSVIATAALNYDHAAAAAAQTIADRGGAVARESGLLTTVLVREILTPWRGVSAAAEELEVDLIVCARAGRAASHAQSSARRRPRWCIMRAVPCWLCRPDRARRTARRSSDTTVRREPGTRSSLQPSCSTITLLSSCTLDEVFAGQAQDIADEGATLARELGLDARPVTVEARPGPWRALAADARSARAALIVVGGRGRGTVASTLLGSVSASLAHNAELPVLVVRSTDA